METGLRAVAIGTGQDFGAGNREPDLRLALAAFPPRLQLVAAHFPSRCHHGALGPLGDQEKQRPSRWERAGDHRIDLRLPAAGRLGFGAVFLRRFVPAGLGAGQGKPHGRSREFSRWSRRGVRRHGIRPSARRRTGHAHRRPGRSGVRQYARSTATGRGVFPVAEDDARRFLHRRSRSCFPLDRRAVHRALRVARGSLCVHRPCAGVSRFLGRSQRDAGDQRLADRATNGRKHAPARRRTGRRLAWNGVVRSRHDGPRSGGRGPTRRFSTRRARRAARFLPGDGPRRGSRDRGRSPASRKRSQTG